MTDFEKTWLINIIAYLELKPPIRIEGHRQQIIIIKIFISCVIIANLSVCHAVLHDKNVLTSFKTRDKYLDKVNEKDEKNETSFY